MRFLKGPLHRDPLLLVPRRIPGHHVQGPSQQRQRQEQVPGEVAFFHHQQREYKRVNYREGIPDPGSDGLCALR